MLELQKSIYISPITASPHEIVKNVTDFNSSSLTADMAILFHRFINNGVKAERMWKVIEIYNLV